jgi:predicted alpha/beta hydrolase family esterase
LSAASVFSLIDSREICCMSSTPILFVPGLRDHVAEHWQTLAAQERPGSRTVPPLQLDRLSCAARIEALDRAIREIDGAPILVAHSAGVLMVAHWAAKHDRPIKGALLATPADIDEPLPAGYPTMDELTANGWFPIPRKPLPFPSIVAASSDDPLANPNRVALLAKDWGSRLVMLGRVGHLNPASGFGPWPMAGSFIDELDAALEPVAS